MNDAWSGHSHEFKLKGGEIIAILRKSGAAWHEQGLQLDVQDGRRVSWHRRRGDSDDDCPLEAELEYGCWIEITGSEAPDAWCGDPASIVIRGTHENGHTLEIRGKGFIGKDDKGSTAVSFDKPPLFLMPGYESEDQGGDGEPANDDFDAEKAWAHMEALKQQRPR